ncbi:MAG: phosphoglycerate dehydrogenase [Thermodesulfobacteriota bacterium]
MKILISDGLRAEGRAILETMPAAAIEVHDRLARPELLARIADADGLIVRSHTRVDGEVLAAGRQLQVVGRAGTGVDNIDVPAATARGVLVMNTPGANAMAAAEHTFALMLALARHVARADCSLRAGHWEKSRFIGTELYGQILGLVGLGRIGSLVAARAVSFGMRVLAADPYLTPESAGRLGVELVPLADLLARADFVSLHTPLTRETNGLIDRAALARMKPSARLINCARGGLVDEAALAEALQEGRLAGAALDVFAQEPPGDSPLLGLEQVVLTPHLGASSEQAQVNVAVALAQQLVAYFQQGVVTNAVNAPSVPPAMQERLTPFMDLAQRLGAFLAQCLPGSLRQVGIAYGGEVVDLERAPVSQAALAGLLTRVMAEGVNLVSAPVRMRERGIAVQESFTSERLGYASLVTLSAGTDRGEMLVAGTVLPERGCRIVRVGEHLIEAPLAGTMLLVTNHDRPGVIGIIGTTLGRAGVNIADMHLSRRQATGMAMSLVAVDGQVPPAAIQTLRDHPDITGVTLVEV